MQTARHNGPLARTDAADGPRVCAAPGCAEPGRHRAPQDRRHLNLYVWFCLEHVRDYNAAWNFCAGMSEDEMEAEIRRDTVWRRPSWRLGAWRMYRVHDPFGLFEDGNHKAQAPGAPAPRGEEAAALAIFKLDASAGAAAIKARYKELAKRLHPDTNGGDKAAEEQLKDVNRAYATLMQRTGGQASRTHRESQGA